jgi:hypothetical protein
MIVIGLAAEHRMAQLQRAFANAIFFDDAPIPDAVRTASGRAHASRFGVYRNNVIAGLINAIAARYPVSRRLLWDDTFIAAAHRYVMTKPPNSPVLLEYGDDFPQYLRGIGQSASSDYLADVAELEAARTRAYHAADATPLSRDTLAALSPDGLADIRVRLHPSVTLIKSRFPVVSIWETNQQANDNTLTTWRPECVLVARPHLQVEVHRLTSGAYEFFAALAEGQNIGEAIELATASAPGFDLAECFNTLIATEVVVGLESPRV